jgi:hypothetical protein
MLWSSVGDLSSPQFTLPWFPPLSLLLLPTDIMIKASDSDVL